MRTASIDYARRTHAEALRWARHARLPADRAYSLRVARNMRLSIAAIKGGRA